MHWKRAPEVYWKSEQQVSVFVSPYSCWRHASERARLAESGTREDTQRRSMPPRDDQSGALLEDT